MHKTSRGTQTHTQTNIFNWFLTQLTKQIHRDRIGFSTSNVGITEHTGKNKLYYKWKKRPVETIPGLGGRAIKENDGGGEFNYDILQELL
jgi:hypothetical protein